MGLRTTSDPAAAPRIERWWGPAVGAAVASAAFTSWWLHWFDFVDLEVYRAGGLAWLHGHDIYLAHPAGSPLPFTYPPFATIVFAPLAVLPTSVARVAMSMVSVVALAAAVSAALRLAAPGRPRRNRWMVTAAVCAFAPLLEPVRDTLRFGQINLVLMALVLVDLAGGDDVARRRPRYRGVLIGVAAAVKLTPAIFILYLLATRRTRDALTALTTAALTTLGAVALLPSASVRYWTHLVFDDRRIGSPGLVWNQSLRGAVARLAGSSQQGRVVWVMAAAAAVLGGLTLAARAERSGDDLLGIGLAALTGLLVSPISWDHHWVWAVPVAIGLWSRWPAVTAAWTAVFCLASMSWWPLAGQDDYHLGFQQGLVADSYVLAAVVLIAFVALRMDRRSVNGPVGAEGLEPPTTAL